MQRPAVNDVLAGRTVLVVDDNQDFAESLARLLELAGHRVEVAYDGEEALAACARCRPEAVVLDIGLPRLDGYEVARRLRRDPAHQGVLLVAVSGYGKDEDRERGREAGFDHYLVKPADPGVLKAILAAC